MTAIIFFLMKKPFNYPVMILMLASAFPIAACASGAKHTMPPLETVRELDVRRYLGKWYEIAAIPQRFQKGCVASTATYSLREDGDIDVLNECRLETLDGKHKAAHGKAWVVDPAEPGKLQVRFFWPFKGEYWVIELGDDYSYSVVGHPSRDYLWILSRTPRMPQEQLDGILGRLKERAYDVSRIVKTLQPQETR